jgi:hypothetical protein
MHDEGKLTVDFKGITSFPLIGRLAGAFHVEGGRRLCSGKGPAALGEYPFAIPDQRELIQLTNA